MGGAVTRRIGFTGGRRLPSHEQLEWLTETLAELYEPGAELHHGDCVGKDATAHLVALRIGYRVVVHPPDVDFFRAHCVGFAEMRAQRPYLLRNNDIVRETATLVAVPDGGPRGRSGTWYTVRRAIKDGRDVRLCPHRTPAMNVRA